MAASRYPTRAARSAHGENAGEQGPLEFIQGRRAPAYFVQTCLGGAQQDIAERVWDEDVGVEHHSMRRAGRSLIVAKFLADAGDLVLRGALPLLVGPQVT